MTQRGAAGFDVRTGINSENRQVRIQVQILADGILCDVGNGLPIRRLTLQCGEPEGGGEGREGMERGE